jgi:hypothetical protein
VDVTEHGDSLFAKDRHAAMPAARLLT